MKCIFLFFILTGCSAVLKIEPSGPPVNSFNKYAQNKYGSIFFTDTTKTEGLNIAVIADSLFWVADNTLKRIPLSRVDHVSFRSRNAGHVISGMVGGLLAAQVISLLLFKSDNCFDCEEETDWNAVNDWATISVAGIVGGGIVGLTVGGTKTYYFNFTSYKQLNVK